MRADRRKVVVGLGWLLSATAIGGVGVAAQPKEKVIKILARRFSYSPNHLDLKLGVPVVLEFKTADVLMGFNAPDFQVRADIVPGKVVRVPLTPDKETKPRPKGKAATKLWAGFVLSGLGR